MQKTETQTKAVKKSPLEEWKKSIEKKMNDRVNVTSSNWETCYSTPRVEVLRKNIKLNVAPQKGKLWRRNKKAMSREK